MKTEGYNNMKKWVCDVCGYEVEQDAVPEECPVCGVDSSHFKPE
jgi:rubrerythrin